MTARQLARTGVDGILEGAGMIFGALCLVGLFVLDILIHPRPLGGK